MPPGSTASPTADVSALCWTAHILPSRAHQTSLPTSNQYLIYSKKQKQTHYLIYMGKKSCIKSFLMVNVLTSAPVNLCLCVCVSPQRVSAAGGCATRSLASVFVLRRQCDLRVTCVRLRPSAITRCWAAKAATAHQPESVKETRDSVTSSLASAGQSRIRNKTTLHGVHLSPMLL